MPTWATKFDWRSVTPENLADAAGIVYGSIYPVLFPEDQLIALKVQRQAAMDCVQIGGYQWLKPFGYEPCFFSNGHTCWVSLRKQGVLISSTRRHGNVEDALSKRHIV